MPGGTDLDRFFKCHAETKCPESRGSTKYRAITEMIELHTSRVHLFSGFAKEQKTGDSVTPCCCNSNKQLST